MAELRILADPDILTVADMISLEAGSFIGIRDVFARLAVDAKDQPLPFEEAKVLVDKLTLRQLRTQAESLSTRIRDVAVPPVKGSA